MLLVHEMLTQSRERVPHHPLLISGGEFTTFADLDARSRRLAATLQQAGLARGDRVVIVMENSPALVVSMFATLMAGGVFVIVNPTTKADKLAYLLNDCRAHAVIADGAPLRRRGGGAGDGSVGHHDGLGRRRSPDLPHGLSYDQATSVGGRRARGPGSSTSTSRRSSTRRARTGEPKGVMLTHRNMLTARDVDHDVPRERRGRRDPRRAAALVRLRPLPDDHGVPPGRAARARALVRVPGARCSSTWSSERRHRLPRRADHLRACSPR